MFYKGGACIIAFTKWVEQCSYQVSGNQYLGRITDMHLFKALITKQKVPILTTFFPFL